MKKIVTYEFTEEDKKLLATPLPDHPCEGCIDSIGCCGCSKGRAYTEAIKPYKEAGIYDIAVKLKELETLQSKRKALQIEIEKKEKEVAKIKEALRSY